MYFNTTHETGQLLIDYTNQAKNQDSLVLKAFRIIGRPLTPSEVWGFLTGSREIPMDTPITSIRRSITNLTNDGKLFKTNLKGKGKYGRNEYKWIFS